MGIDFDAPKAESLILEAGQSSQGKLLRYDKATDRNGDDHVIAVLEIDGAPRGIWLIHQALRSGFARLKPQPGEVVGVRNNGQKESASTGRRYWDWSVAVDRGDEGYTPDWDAMGGDEPPLEDPEGAPW